MPGVILDAFIWWCGIVFEVVIVFRGLRASLIARYPFFYAYAGSILALWVPLYFAYLHHLVSYPTWYWWAQLITLITGYGVLLEIFRHVLSPWPGAERVASIVWAGAFVMILCVALAYPIFGSQWSSGGTMIELERDLRCVQALFLVGIFCVIAYYGIALGRNMKGMMTGYGLYIGGSLVCLAIRSYAGPSFYAALYRIQPVSFNVAALIWMSTLWRYEPNPRPSAGARFEMEYEALAARTRNMVGAMRSYLVRSARP